MCRMPWNINVTAFTSLDVVYVNAWFFYFKALTYYWVIVSQRF